MAREGLLPPEMRVELIEGEVLDMLPTGEPHQGVFDRLSELLILAAAKRVTVRHQGRVRLDRYTELQPDFALLKGRQGRVSPPMPHEVLLVIEVSDSSLRYDRQVKLPLYARHGIPEAWIIDVAASTFHVFHSPQRGRYAHRSIVRAPGTMTVKAFPEMAVDLTGLLGDAGARASCP